jgi:hypothetical protein
MIAADLPRVEVPLMLLTFNPNRPKARARLYRFDATKPGVEETLSLLQNIATIGDLNPAMLRRISRLIEHCARITVQQESGA